MGKPHMTDRGKLAIWLGIGVSICLLLIPAITERGGMQRYINFAAFLGLFFGGMVAIVGAVWLGRKRRKDPSPLFPGPVLRASQTMVLVMIAFGVFWFDFSQARAHRFWVEYRFQLQAPADLGDGWLVGSVADHGIDPKLIDFIVERFVNDDDYKWQHSFLLARGNELLVDEYFYDESVEEPHDLRSANKTITSILIGIAIDQGFIGGVDDSVSKYFPGYQSVFEEAPEKRKITIEHLLTMRSGLAADDWDQSSPGNEDRLYRVRDDWVRLFFELPLVNRPGSKFAYSTAGEMTLRAMLVNASGMPLNQFAERFLFNPLGIDRYRWTRTLYGRDDVPIRVELTSRSLAKLGLLFLNDGIWQGRRIVSAEWVSRSTEVHSETNEVSLGNPGFGYLWWRHSFDVRGKEIQGYQAQGAGGQFLFVFPDLETIAVFTSGNYGRPRQRNPLRIMRNELLPALLDAQLESPGDNQRAY